MHEIKNTLWCILVLTIALPEVGEMNEYLLDCYIMGLLTTFIKFSKWKALFCFRIPFIATSSWF